MNIYWYVSKAKLDLLTEQAPGFLTGIKANIGFKLGLLSGSLEGTEPARTAEDLQRVIKKLQSQYEIKDFSQLEDGESPVVVSFDGNAVRQINNNVFWLGMESGSRGLLLAGSPASAIGSPVKSEDGFSPSADPVSAIRSVFSGDGDAAGFGGTRMPLSSSLSYAWRTLMEDADSGTLPRAKGLALFARAVKADRTQLRSIRKGNITELIVGSPIYVEQA
ncbi:MAG: hypothetical protein JSS87_02905 [Acidobacteria bacterium]|nr:hypothetical protein [Acidobacteriota bacterium]